MITDERILSLAWRGVLELWSFERKKLEENPESQIAKFKEQKYWEQLLEIQNLILDNKKEK